MRDDGKGFVATHAGATAFFSWPEFGEMLGGRFDEHPWGISEATVIVEDRTSPISRHLPATFTVTDEHYQLKDFSRRTSTCWRRLDPAKLDLNAPLVHRTDRDFAVAYTKDVRQGPRLLLNARPSARIVGPAVAAADVFRSLEVVDGN